MRLLVQQVARAFYEPRFIILLDQLTRNPVLKDDDLASRMGLQAKELNKLTAGLVKDKLIEIYRRNELKEGALRAVGRQYYYIDYKHFCDVVKWRVAEMRRLIDKDLRNELDSKGYICPQCSQSYTPLDVDRLIDFETGTFLCEVCRTELIDNENAESVRGSQDRMQRFNRQMSWIREGLRKSEEMVLPAFDVEKYVRENFTEVDKEGGEDDGLKIAGGRHAIDEGIGIVIRTDKDEATKKEEREREAEAKRQQNQMPSWHLKSTISGDLTALGIQQQAREAALMQTQAHILDSLTPTSSKVIDGLPSPQEVKPILQQQGVSGLPDYGIPDVKPVIDRQADYYDQYYAQLQFGPIKNGLGGSEPSDEEDIKPSIQELERASRKRSRSNSLNGSDRGSKFLRASVDPLSRSESVSRPPTTGVNTPENGDLNTAEGDPLVTVNGTQMRYSAVTEEHYDMMTSDEYTAYFEVYQIKNG